MLVQVGLALLAQSGIQVLPSPGVAILPRWHLTARARLVAALPCAGYLLVVPDLLRTMGVPVTRGACP